MTLRLFLKIGAIPAFPLLKVETDSEILELAIVSDMVFVSVSAMATTCSVASILAHKRAL